MRSIGFKIFLVLVVISLVGALFTTVYIQFRTRNAFDTYVRDQYQLAFADLLVAHYQEFQSWENADEVFRSFYLTTPGGGPGLGLQGSGSEGGGGQGRNPNRPAENLPPLPPFVLTDLEGRVIWSFTNHPGYLVGDQIPGQEQIKSLPLEIDGETVGRLAAVPTAPNRSSIQENFLQTVQQGLMISLGVTLLLALVLGGILVVSFTKPIRKLVSGTERVASGELGHQVEIDSGDELGRLADSFNRMSRDLENADRSRKQMTADIAHDLRTPLSILHGYTEAMSEGKIDGSPEIYRVMHQQAQHLNYLIDDLRTLSLLDSKELDFKLQVVDPGLVAQQAQAAFHPLAAENGIELSLEIADPLPQVKLDPDRLTQALGNLLSNALAVVEEGGQIRVKAREVSGDLVLEISDDGPGISPEDLPHIFQRHYRADKSRGQAKGSSGLGLAITKKLVEAQGGSIQVSSREGEGTTFQLVFPAV